MRYLMMIKAGKDFEAGRMPPAALLDGMAKLTEEMTRAGALLSCGGLQPTSAGARVSYANGKRTVTDGPFAEAKEVVGGFAIVEAASKQEAIALAQRVIDVHEQAGVAAIAIEIRAMQHRADAAGERTPVAATADAR